MLLRVRQEQMNAFDKVILRNLEDRLAEYLRQFFPEKCQVLDDPQMRAVIHYGLDRAKKWEITSERGVHLYLAAMFMLGSGFDTDAQYPWAASTLTDQTMDDPDERIFQLSDEILNYLGRVEGEEEQHWKQALTAFCLPTLPCCWNSSVSDVDVDIDGWLRAVWPAKCVEMGDELVRRTIHKGKLSAGEHGFAGNRGLALYVGMMFMLGQGWLHDPQFPWNQRSGRHEDIDNAGERVERLHRTAIDYFNALLQEAVGEED